MESPGITKTTQGRSQQTLERILAASTDLVAEFSYEELTIADIANRSSISVGGFYSRFRNKDALFQALRLRLADETHLRIEAALKRDWSRQSLRDLVYFVVAGNAELYTKYRGVLKATRLAMHSSADPQLHVPLKAYNARIAQQLEQLLLIKQDDIRLENPRQAVRTAIACISSMLRDAIVFGDVSLYPSPSMQEVILTVTHVVYRYLGASENKS